MKIKKFVAIVLAALMAASCLTGCGGSTSADGDSSGSESTGSGGTIIWLSNINSGPAYDGGLALMTAYAEKLGYNLKVVFGDAYNDPAANLAQVKNEITDDTVGLILSQDGGIGAIMEEYPELYVAGYNTDMTSVYNEGGDNAALLENDHFLGTICDGHADGTKMAELYYNWLIEKGYKKVAVINFPSYAFPNQGVANETLLAKIEEYNKTAADADKIEVVGETTTLEFQPLEESWFLEEGHDDLDCIVSLCAGITFVYPTLASAKANGTCSADTKMITGGYENDASILADCGDDGTITCLSVSPLDNIAYSLVLIDRAIRGEQFSDWTNDRVDSVDWVMDSTEDFQKVASDSVYGTYNPEDAQIKVDDIASFGSYQELVSALQNLSVDTL